MSEPSFEETPARATDYYAAILKREIIALRGDHNDAVSYLDGLHTLVCDRLDALESQARPLQEDGELAVCRPDASIFDRPESEITLEEWRDAADSWERQHDEVFALGIKASMAGDKARSERDAAIARAERLHSYLLMRSHDSLCACREGGGKPCTCGLADALDGSGQHE